MVLLLFNNVLSYYEYPFVLLRRERLSSGLNYVPWVTLVVDKMVLESTVRRPLGWMIIIAGGVKTSAILASDRIRCQ